MKKAVIIFFLVILCLATFAGHSLATVFGRWQNPTAIKTYIPPDHKYSVMMKHAFAEWSRVTQNKVVFKYVSTPNVAQLRVYFVKQIDSQNRKELDRAIGLTKSATNPVGKFVKVRVYIAEKSPEGRLLRKDSIYTVMLHEIGHAIGLNHSNDPDSIMFPTEDDRQEIAKSDLRVLGKIYGW